MGRSKAKHSARKRSQTWPHQDKDLYTVRLFPRFFVNNTGWKDNTLYIMFVNMTTAMIVSKDGQTYPFDGSLDYVLGYVNGGIWQEITKSEAQELKEKAAEEVSELSFPKYYVKTKGWNIPTVVYVRQDGYNAGALVHVTGKQEDTVIPFESIKDAIAENRWEEITEEEANALMASAKLQHNSEENESV